MATLLKFFQKQPLPTSNEVDLSEGKSTVLCKKSWRKREMHGTGICEAVDKPESDSESEDDPFADIDEQ